MSGERRNGEAVSESIKDHKILIFHSIVVVKSKVGI